MTLDQLRSKEAEKRRELKAEKFEQMRLKAGKIVQAQDRNQTDTSSPILAQNANNAPLPLKGQKKKKMFTESGKEYFQM